jgi:hypothetical protein
VSRPAEGALHGLLLGALLSLVPGCGLTSALTYPTAGESDASNIASMGEVAFAALSARGLGVVTLGTGMVVRVIEPPAGSRRVDDVAVADGLLFTLDAEDGMLAAWSIADALVPVLVSGPIEVPVGPFSGVSAGGGRVVVSGGTDELTVRAYDTAGRLTDPHASIDVARGQPDVLVAPDGKRAYVSTHFETTVFGLTVVDLSPLSIVGRLMLHGAGFTEGGTKPANFPLVSALGKDRLYLAFGGGLAVIDIADPTHPKHVVTIPLGMQAVHLAIDGNQAAVVGVAPPMLLMVDLSAPDAPVVTKRDPLPGRATGVALSPTKVAVAAGERGVIVLPRAGGPAP